MQEALNAFTRATPRSKSGFLPFGRRHHIIITGQPSTIDLRPVEYLIERAWWGRDRSWMGLGHPRPYGRTPERRWFLPRTRGEGVSRDTLCGRPDKRLCLTTFRLTGHKNRRILCTLADFLRTNYCLPQAVNLKGNNLCSPAQLGAVCFYSLRLLFVYLGLGWDTDAALWTSDPAISGCIGILTLWVIS